LHHRDSKPTNAREAEFKRTNYRAEANDNWPEPIHAVGAASPSRGLSAQA